MRNVVTTVLLLTLTSALLAASIEHQRQMPVSLKTSIGILHGTLELPAAPGPFPVALIIAGSGPTDRNGNDAQLDLNTDCYKLLAEALALNGIASLRYDKRGAGEDAMLGLFESQLRFENFVADANGWGKQLRADKRFSVLIIIGHSEGSLIGMLAAREMPADGYVSIAGAGEPAQTLLLKQLKPQLPPDLYKQSETIVSRLENGNPVANVPAQLDAIFRPSVQPYLISWFHYDPVEGIAKLKMPVMIIQGQRDLQVSTEDAQALANAYPGAKLVLIPAMNHVLKDVGTSKGENLAAYKDPALPIDKQLITQITSFIRQVVQHKGDHHAHS